MTREERGLAIGFFELRRRIFCDNHLKNCPKNSNEYIATLIEKSFYDMAIKALEKESCEDAVSRQAVINTLDEMDKILNEDRTVERYRDLLKECYIVLPSVNPQEPNTDRVEYGTDGNAYRLTISNGKEFEQEPKTGHWIDKFGGVYRCSECRELIELDCEITTPKSIERFRYCPNCGARMEG